MIEMPIVRRSTNRNRWPWKQIAVGVACTVVGIIFCSALHTTMKQQSETIQQLHHQM